MENFISSGSLNTDTYINGVRGRPTLKDVDRQFRNGSFRELQQKNARKKYPEIPKIQKYKNTKINSNEQRYEVSETNLNERRGTVTKSGDRKVTNCLVSKIFIGREIKSSRKYRKRRGRHTEICQYNKYVFRIKNYWSYGSNSDCELFVYYFVYNFE